MIVLAVSSGKWFKPARAGVLLSMRHEPLHHTSNKLRFKRGIAGPLLRPRFAPASGLGFSCRLPDAPFTGGIMCAPEVICASAEFAFRRLTWAGHNGQISSSFWVSSELFWLLLGKSESLYRESGGLRWWFPSRAELANRPASFALRPIFSCVDR